MDDREAAITEALRVVWCRHRDTLIADLERLVDALTTWNHGPRPRDLGDEIRARSHRIRGSLTMVGRNDGAEDLRTIEAHAVDERGPYAKETVERIHGLLDRLRSVD